MSARAVKHVVLSIYITTLVFDFDQYDTKAKEMRIEYIYFPNIN